MDLILRGKRALVTGSTVGIGFAIARGLARERAEVIVNGRTEQKVAEAVQRISSEVGSRAVGISADLGSAEGVARLVAEAGRVDVLVNNVGIFWPVPFLEISDEDWFRIFEVNLMSGVRLARELLPQMLKRNWGRIIFISSESALQIPPEMVHYGVTKTAQLALSRRTMRPSSVIRRFAEPDEVANLVVFLCGEGSSAITGAALRADGGVVRSIA